MSVNSGQIKRFQIAGEDFDPAGDWTVRASKDKYEHKESTQTGGHFFSRIRQPGMVSGQVYITDDQDATILTDAKDATMLIEMPDGTQYSGTVTYTADGEIAVNDGTLQVELMGEVAKL